MFENSKLRAVFIQATTPIKMMDFDPYDITRQSATFIPGYLGGPLLKIKNGINHIFELYKNNGKKLNVITSFPFKKNVSLSVLAPNGTIYFLFNDGSISIYRPNGKLLKTLPGKENVELICFSNCYHGISFVTNDNVVHFVSFESEQETKTINLPPDKTPQCIVLQSFLNYIFLVACDENIYNLSSGGVLTHMHSFDKQKEHITDIYSCLESHSFAVRTSNLNGDKFNIFINQVKRNSTAKSIQNLEMNVYQGAWVSPEVFVFSCNSEEKRLYVLSNLQLTICDYPKKVLCIFQDMGCVRIYSDKEVFMMQEPKDCLLDLFLDSSVKLADGFEIYKQGDIKFMNQIKNIINERTINSYIIAAKESIVKEHQIYLMSLASFARNYSVDLCADQFAETIQYIQLVNTLNSDDVGMCFPTSICDTIVKYLFDRLMNSKQYSVAEDILHYLDDITETDIATRWAEDKIFENYDIDKITKVLDSYPDVDYTRIVHAAIEKNMVQQKTIYLAMKIKNPKQRVLILYDINPIQAESAALESKDGAAIIAYLSKKRENIVSSKDFQRNPLLVNHFMSFQKYKLAKELEELREQKKHYSDKITPVPSSLKLLLPCHDNLNNRNALNDIAVSSMFAYNDYGKNIDDIAFARRALKGSNYELWLEHQQKMLDKLGDNGVSHMRGPTLSPRQYIELCFINNMDNIAKSIADNFKFSDEQVEFIRIHGYIKKEKWDLLENYTRTEPKHLKWEGVAAELARAQYKDKALRIAQLIKGNKFFELMEEFQYWEEALTAAISRDDKPRIEKYKEILKRK